MVEFKIGYFVGVFVGIIFGSLVWFSFDLWILCVKNFFLIDFYFLLRSTFIFEMCEFKLKSHLNNAVDCKVGPWRCNNQMKGVVLSLL